MLRFFELGVNLMQASTVRYPLLKMQGKKETKEKLDESLRHFFNSMPRLSTNDMARQQEVLKELDQVTVDLKQEFKKSAIPKATICYSVRYYLCFCNCLWLRTICCNKSRYFKDNKCATDDLAFG